MNEWIDRYFISFDETAIHYSVSRLTQEPSAIFLGIHGFAEYGTRLQTLTDSLTARGILCVVPDLRGHGKSGGRKVYVNRFQDFHQDLEALFLYLSKVYPGVPIMVGGISLGGLIGATWLGARGQAKPAPSGLILCAPFFGFRIRAPLWKEILARIFEICLPQAAFNDGIQSSSLMRDAGELKRYKADADVQRVITAGLYREFRRGQAMLARVASRISVPLCVILAGDDHIVLNSAIDLVYDQTSSLDKIKIVIDGAYHDLLHDSDREKVVGYIADWIAKHRGAVS